MICLSTLFEGQHYFGAQRNSGEYGIFRYGTICICNMIALSVDSFNVFYLYMIPQYILLTNDLHDFSILIGLLILYYIVEFLAEILNYDLFIYF